MFHKILNAVTASGAETAIVTEIETVLKKTGAVCKTDAMGSLCAARQSPDVVGGTAFFCAVDMPGLIVTYLEKDGCARVSPLGKVNLAAASLRRLTDETGNVTAVLVPDPDKGDSVDAAYIKYTGTLNRGDILCFSDAPIWLGNDTVASPGVGNKACAAALCEVLASDELPQNKSVTAVFCTQSALGNRGAAPAAFGIQVDNAVCLEPYEGDTLGIKLNDKSVVCDAALSARLMDAAKDCGIPLKAVSENETVSDAARVSTAGSGVKTAVLLVPVKNRGGVSELLCVDVIRHIKQILLRFLSTK